MTLLPVDFITLRPVEIKNTLPKMTLVPMSGKNLFKVKRN
jgi:hypothetical protein